jgi:hypothetical protein
MTSKISEIEAARKLKLVEIYGSIIEDLESVPNSSHAQNLKAINHWMTNKYKRKVFKALKKKE